MKGWGTALIKDVKSRGYVEVNGVLYPPNSEKALSIPIKQKKRSKTIKTGWIDDSRNIKNKEKYNDPFIQFVKQELGIDVWPEFYICTDRLFRIDYAIPLKIDGSELRLSIEVDGGIWLKGNSGHSSGSGIKRDQEKASLLASLGWLLIRVQPSELVSLNTLNLIKKAIDNGRI